MRHLFLFLLLCLLSLPTLAQEEYAMPELPDEPIFVTEGFAMRQHYVWLDDDTVRFAPYHRDNYYIATDPYEAYEYHVSSKRMERLDWSPFYIEPTAVFQDAFVIPEPNPNMGIQFPYLIPSWPYAADASSSTRFFYTSRESFECGTMCSYAFSYSGIFNPETNGLTLSPPLSRPFFVVLKPFWTVNGDYAVVVNGAETGASCCADSLFLVDISNNVYGERFALLDTSHEYQNAPKSSSLYALNTEFTPRVLYGNWREYQLSELVLWTASRLGSEDCHCMLLPENKSYSLEPEQHFVGANFIEGDEGHFLAVAPDGLRLYEVETGEFTVINPELNSNWIDLAVFSPDNQHVAVIVDSNLYVLPTGFTNP